VIVNATNIIKTNNHLSSQLIIHKKGPLHMTLPPYHQDSSNIQSYNRKTVIDYCTLLALYRHMKN